MKTPSTNIQAPEKLQAPIIKSGWSYPHHWDVKTLDLLEKANPGGQNWGGVAKDLKVPYGQFNLYSSASRTSLTLASGVEHVGSKLLSEFEVSFSELIP